MTAGRLDVMAPLMWLRFLESSIKTVSEHHHHHIEDSSYIDSVKLSANFCDGNCQVKTLSQM